MASLISADLTLNGVKKRVVFFSNPNDKASRVHMTVKASLDEGLTWPEDHWIELFGPSGYGYSCLTMVDGQHVGIIYEGIKELYYQKIQVNDFFNNK
jgi:sialidase-1